MAAGTGMCLRLEQKGNGPSEAEEEFLRKFLKDPESLTVQEALDFVVKNYRIILDGKCVWALNDDILQDIRDALVAVLKRMASSKNTEGDCSCQ